MFLKHLTCVAAVLLGSASAAVHERRDASFSQWVRREAVPSDIIVPVRIGMAQQNLDHGHDLLTEISNPRSRKYGQHLSAEEVHDLFAPHQDTVDVLSQWLHDSGVTADRISQSINKQWLQFDAAVSELEALLNAKYHMYEHAKTGKLNMATEEYSIPDHLRGHVDFVTPGIKLVIPSGNPIEKRDQPVKTAAKRHLDGKARSQGSSLRSKRGVQAVTTSQGRKEHLPPIKRPISSQAMTTVQEEKNSLALCDEYITPACIFAMYNLTKPTRANPDNKLGIFEDLGDVYSQEDLNLFFANIAPNIPQGTHPLLQAVDGAVAPVPVDEAGAESDLDFQISYPLIYPQGTVLYQTDDPVVESNYTYSGFLNVLLDALDGSYCSEISPLDPPYPDPSNAPGSYKGNLQCGIYKPTNVISISYGGPEYDLPASYQRRQCNEFMKLGLQGVTIVNSSGDYGVSSYPGDPTPNGCIDNYIFTPSFPTTCPYVLSVGSTFLPDGASAAKDEEIATTRFPSGGGFSNLYRVPNYQSYAVSAYFKTAGTQYPYYETTDQENIGGNGGLYNRIGRGYPDVAAIGDNVVIYNKGKAVRIGGTSASSPVFASILTRINEERLAVGKGTVGFVNPTLYQHPEVLHDITQGNNPGCNTTGFVASKGWDPVTGLGTPNYPKMLKLFMSL